METLNAKFHKSSKDWSDEGSRLFNDTRDAGKHFVDFVQHEAKDWGDYLSEHSKMIGDQGWGLLRPDALVARLRSRHAATNEQENTDEVEAETRDSEETEEVEETAVVEIEEEANEEIAETDEDAQA